MAHVSMPLQGMETALLERSDNGQSTETDESGDVNWNEPEWSLAPGEGQAPSHSLRSSASMESAWVRRTFPGKTISAVTSRTHTPIHLQGKTPTTPRQKAAAALRKHGPTMLFYGGLVAWVVVLFAGGFLDYYFAQNEHLDQIEKLVAKLGAAVSIICFVVFLFPFVRFFQGQIFAKVAVVASFFNPQLHIALAVAFMFGGTLHSILLVVSAVQSCGSTWCPFDSKDVHAQAACLQTFCQNNTLSIDNSAVGLPSFTNAFGPALPGPLLNPQRNIRSFYSGFVCWFLFAVICFLSLPFIRRRHFELFYYSHYISLAAMPVFVAHVWTVRSPSPASQLMIIPCSVAMLVYAFDKLYSVFFRRYLSRTIDCIMFPNGRILELRLRPVPAWPLLCRLSSCFSATNCCFGPPKFSFAPGARRIRALTCFSSSVSRYLSRRLRGHQLPRHQQVSMAPIHRSPPPPSSTHIGIYARFFLHRRRSHATCPPDILRPRLRLHLRHDQGAKARGKLALAALPTLLRPQF